MKPSKKEAQPYTSKTALPLGTSNLPPSYSGCCYNESALSSTLKVSVEDPSLESTGCLIQQKVYIHVTSVLHSTLRSCNADSAIVTHDCHKGVLYTKVNISVPVVDRG